jgi:hypothetical protein
VNEIHLSLPIMRRIFHAHKNDLRLATSAILAALILALPHAQADSNSVFSVNIVGFQQRAIPDGGQFDMISAPFNTASNTLIEIFGTNTLYGNNAPGSADRLRLWDPVQQMYVNIGVAGNGRFYRQTASGSWVSPLEDVSDWTVFETEGWWLLSGALSPTERNITFSGDIVTDATLTYNMHPGFHLIAYPFSVPMALNSMSFAMNGASANNAPGTADRVRVWDSINQSYINYGLAGNGIWYRQTATGSWVSPLEEATHIFQPGEAFFYYSHNSFEWEENNPYISEL